MSSVREILQQSGIDEYTINSLDERVTGALGNVLAKAEQDKMSVDQFWTNTYNPGVSQWEAEKSDLARRIAASEARNAALERERQVLAEQGLVTESPVTPRNDRGQYVTPGTPTFSGDANDIVSRASMGLAQIADVDYRHRALFNAPMPITPSQLIKEADARGVDPLSYAEQRFGFSKKETEIAAQREKEKEQAIRDDERRKMTSQYTDSGGSFNPMTASTSMSAIRRATQAGERKDPLKLDAAGRRKQALESIHRAVEERAQRDA